MKTELIEYHRKQRNKALSKHGTMTHIHNADFHERAVKWLEGIVAEDRDELIERSYHEK